MIAFRSTRRITFIRPLLLLTFIFDSPFIRQNTHIPMQPKQCQFEYIRETTTVLIRFFESNACV